MRSATTAVATSDRRSQRKTRSFSTTINSAMTKYDDDDDDDVTVRTRSNAILSCGNLPDNQTSDDATTKHRRHSDMSENKASSFGGTSDYKQHINEIVTEDEG